MAEKCAGRFGQLPTTLVFLATLLLNVAGGCGQSNQYVEPDRPEVTVKGMSEEHGILDLSKTTWKPKVGDQVRIIPNHVCIVTHLNDSIVGIRGEELETQWPVAARGRAKV